VLGASMLLLLAVVFAFNLGQGRSPLQFEPDDETPTPTASASTGTQVVAGTTATDLDPQGEDKEENPQLAPLVVDGDPATSWRSQTYTQQLGPGGLKTGVGLVVDLGASVDVRRIRVDLVGSPTDISVFVTPDPPTAVAGLTPVVTETAQTRLDAPVEATGRYVVVWLTSLPAVEGGFRGTVAEVVVRRAAG
jgi:serine/threonine kinase PknH